MRWWRLWSQPSRGRHAAGRGPVRRMPEIVLTPARVVREPDVVPPPRAAEVAPTALVPAPRSPEQVVDRPAPLPTSADAPSPVVELGFADGRRQVVTPSAGDALAITEAVRRLTAKVG